MTMDQVQMVDDELRRNHDTQQNVKWCKAIFEIVNADFSTEIDTFHCVMVKATKKGSIEKSTCSEQHHDEIDRYTKCEIRLVNAKFN